MIEQEKAVPTNIANQETDSMMAIIMKTFTIRAAQVLCLVRAILSWHSTPIRVLLKRPSFEGTVECIALLFEQMQSANFPGQV